MDKIYIIKGDDIIKMTLDLLNNMNPPLGDDMDLKIGIKPNLVCASTADEGATTHPQIVEGIIIYLISRGYKNIIMLEGSWIGDSTNRAYKACGYERISEKYNVPFFDTKKDEYVTKTIDKTDYHICKMVYDLDYLINVPLIKGHC